MFCTRHHRTPNCSTRKAVAVVELAICMPILVLVLFATIEACVMLQLQHNLAITAYEGARIGIMPGTNATSVQTQCEMLLVDRDIAGYTITLDPPDPSTMDVGDALTVTVEADCVANTVLAAMFFDGKILSESVVMLAE
ncbi:TadE/TadG family type IV pilus assembly protein [Rubripirellula reticaptiva]|nr:TadE family protein [Rubripirellula reticaptiva]